MRSPTWLAASVAVALGSLSCGARSDLEADRAPSDPPAIADASTDAASDRPTWARGVWWFQTVRAVCDTFAVEFCGGREVAARWSRDDGCLGEAPTTAAPIRGRIVSAEPDLVTLRFDLPPGASEPTTVRLRAAGAGLPGETLDLDFDPAPDFIHFPWSQGQRPEAIGVPREVTRDFVHCD